MKVLFLPLNPLPLRGRGDCECPLPQSGGEIVCDPSRFVKEELGVNPCRMGGNVSGGF